MPPRARTDGPSAGGYRKGEATRARLLDVAVRAFGQHGFSAVTTRQIAEEAGASLPTLNYYFGDKAGLYLACAEAIAGRYERAMGLVAGEARDALQAPMPPDAARAHLKRLFGALVAFMFTVEDKPVWALFVQREIADPGAAYEVLFSRVWAPGAELTAALIARALGQAQTTAEARMRAILLNTSLTAFQAGRRVFDRVLGPEVSAQDQAATVARLVEEQIDLLGRPLAIGPQDR